MKKERLVAFFDAILAIIMTILVLELEKPSVPTIEAFLALGNNFFAYVLSFFWLGSLWMGMNGVWEHARYISNKVIWWTLILMFFASLIPYATSLVSTYFDNRIIQGFYGVNVILMTACNYMLHQVLDEPNQEYPELLKATAQYRKLLLPDILIKIIGLILALVFAPQIMMYSVLVAAIYITVRKIILDKKQDA